MNHTHRRSCRSNARGTASFSWLGALSLALGAHAVVAHELWLEREAGTYLLQQGHRSAAHAGPEAVPYRADFLREGFCFDARGLGRPANTPGGYPARFAGPCAALLVWASSGVWTKTAWETLNAPKTGIAGVLKSWRSEERVKRLDAWSPALAKPLSQGLEITPLQNPFALSTGDKISLQVSYAGQARAGVPVAYDGAVRGASDETGKVVLKLRHPGLQLFSASIELPLADGQADSLVLAAMLNFELPSR